MKHIGIVDITTVGACICANEIVAAAARTDPSGKHPEFTMHAFSFDEYKKFVVTKDWIGLAAKILDSIEKLKLIGADFIIIPSNTPHFAIAYIHEKSPLPVLNLIEITADECRERNYKRVAVLGTKFTMQGGLYNEYLHKRNIIPVIPADEICERIHNLIMDEIIPSRINPESVEQLKREIQKMDCDAVILGCTELPDVFNEENLGKPVLDTTRIIARAALKFAIAAEYRPMLFGR